MQHSCEEVMPVVRVARMAAEDGLPSRTDFWVLDRSNVDFSQEAAPSELVSDVTSLNTRCGNGLSLIT
jgi:hypothetical protein